MNVAAIFARAGSKGLKNKNQLLFRGKPLIAWSIASAFDAGCFDAVVVSTDSPDIAEIAISYGASVPFLRPSNLATDSSPEIDSWRHLLKYYEDNNISIESLTSLPCTSPLRSTTDILKCLKLFKSKNADLVISVVPSHRNPFFKMVYLDEYNRSSLVCPSSIPIFRRQDAPVTFDMTTVCFVASSSYIKKSSSQFDGAVYAHVVSPETAVDIDTLFDFKVAESIAQYHA